MVDKIIKVLKSNLGLALLGGAAVYLKEIPSYVISQLERKLTFKVVVKARSGRLYDIIENYIQSNYRQKLYAETVAFWYTPIIKEYSKDSLRENLDRSNHNSTLLIWHKGVPLLISKNIKEIESSDGTISVNNNIEIRSLSNHKSELYDFIATALYEWEQKRESKFTPGYYIASPTQSWEFIGYARRRSLDTVKLPEGMQKEITHDIDKFLASSKWYEKRGIPWKRGYIFYGPPGNGKTSLIKALAYEYKREVYSLSLSDIRTDASLNMLMNTIPSRSILVIEDIDSFIDVDKKEIKNNNNSTLSFTGMLNALDGVFSSHGLILIATTNDHKLTKGGALMRPGRFDRKFHIPNPSKEQVEEYLQLFFGKKVSLEAYHKSLSYAEIQELCLRHDLNTVINILNNKK